MTNRPRYTVEPWSEAWAEAKEASRRWMVRDTKATPGTQILAVLQSELAAKTAAQALNRGLCETVDAQGRWEDAP